MNLSVYSFTPPGGMGLPTFTVGTGVYVATGDASGVKVLDRVVELPTGLIYDPDGTDGAPRVPQKVWWEVVFQGTTPAAHTQYYNLLALKGYHGTLRARVPGGTGTYYYYTAPARLMEMTGAWEPVYRAGITNLLTVRVTFRLKGHWSAE